MDLLGRKSKAALFLLTLKSANREIQQMKLIAERDKQIAVLQEQVKFLQGKADYFASLAEPPKFSKVPLALSEDEEDAKFMLRAGHINREEYEGYLKAAGALNSEVEFDVEAYQ